MILERLDGKDTAKMIEKPSFHDIHYIREMLFSVFCALDVSQKQFGFHHSDMRLANIMDIGPEPPGIGSGASKARGQQPLTFPSKNVTHGEGPGKYLFALLPWTVFATLSLVIHCPASFIAPKLSHVKTSRSCGLTEGSVVRLCRAHHQWQSAKWSCIRSDACTAFCAFCCEAAILYVYSWSITVAQ